jgi:dolichol-phosphate mannosyltransferase
MLSAVVPVLNEAESLPLLYQELIDVARDHGYEWDLVFVDDGSTDGSWDVIERLARDDAGVQGIRFRRNFGKAAALSAGFAAARGELVFTLDADLQDDPREIPRFLGEIEKGIDVVSGWKQVRNDPWHKVGPSRVFNWLVGYLTGVKLHDHNCGFKCYRREIFDEVRLYGELHRFVPVLAAARGWKVGEIAVNHRPRKFGASKYGVRRFVKGFLDLLTVYFLTGFAQRPAHLLGTFGLASLGVGTLGMTYFTIYWIVRQYWLFTVGADEVKMQPLHERPALLYSVAALLLGVQLLSVGFIAELITAFQGQSTPGYSVRGRVGGKAGSHRQDDAA